MIFLLWSEQWTTKEVIEVLGGYVHSQLSYIVAIYPHHTTDPKVLCPSTQYRQKFSINYNEIVQMDRQ